LSASPFVAVTDGVRVTLRVTPGASRTGFAGLAETAGGGRALKVSVTAIAEDGRANDAVIKLLAKTWRLPKSSLSLIAGVTDRNKILHVSGTPETLMPRLIGALPEDQRS
jgi:uncharacterized protein (TIGR00251 family)